ncbi:hypothetical protein BN159_1383 [Streptomyces davaonensis JCM 4913]|uniref:Uncharacterized protein n=1 Tax=Streptomyces davaonensis (strain DSM 101723 / JCM 4913 / KCC S-0913 / 768) TaxID=1214101 RepID=K4QXV3_STRDJ|nr:hypothetical protein [Streptomyces davaonensis]CCK25762.1 hypothetical protein BN159_1383 [Streptomyces davaonensis JCM 4913]
MITGSQQQGPFVEAVARFEAAVREQEPEQAERAFGEMGRAYRDAAPQEMAQAAPRLAALLPEVPPGPRGTIAVLVGACVESGADPRPCAPHIFVELAENLAAAGEFAERWAETGGGDFPDPESGEVDPAVFERVGPEAALAWLSMPQWEMACVAMLSDPAVRTALDGSLRARLLRGIRAVAEASGHEFKCLTYALLVLDDEPLVVLHRPTGTGYRMRMSGIGDNFQLHTLLADVLVGGGHVPGRAPSPQEAAVCRDAPGQVHTVGSFNLVAPGGEWVWNEGTPTDIPVVDGVRLLVLDPPAYERSWPSGRFFPRMTGDLVLERVLDAAETRYWLEGCEPPK